MMTMMEMVIITPVQGQFSARFLLLFYNIAVLILFGWIQWVWCGVESGQQQQVQVFVPTWLTQPIPHSQNSAGNEEINLSNFLFRVFQSRKLCCCCWVGFHSYLIPFLYAFHAGFWWMRAAFQKVFTIIHGGKMKNSYNLAHMCSNGGMEVNLIQIVIRAREMIDDRVTSGKQ